MKEYNIIGIHVNDRTRDANKIQEILSRFGHHISTRLGLHDKESDSPNGLIIIEVDEKSFGMLQKELGKLDGIEVKSMRF